MISSEEKRIRMTKIAKENEALAKLNEPVRIKRLKKDCPCNKCEKWRAERVCKKLREAFEKSFEQTIHFRTPIIESDIEKPPVPKTTGDVMLMIGHSTSAPQPQTVSRLNVDFTGKTKPPGRI